MPQTQQPSQLSTIEPIVPLYVKESELRALRDAFVTSAQENSEKKREFKTLIRRMDAMLKDIIYREGRFIGLEGSVLTAKHWSIITLADGLGEFLGAAPNYQEIMVHHELYGDLIATVQRAKGKSPATLKEEAEQRNKVSEAKFNVLLSTILLSYPEEERDDVRKQLEDVIRMSTAHMVPKA